MHHTNATLTAALASPRSVCQARTEFAEAVAQGIGNFCRTSLRSLIQTAQSAPSALWCTNSDQTTSLNDVVMAIVPQVHISALLSPMDP